MAQTQPAPQTHSSVARPLAACLGILGWVLLLLQLWLSLANGHADGNTTSEIVTNYLSFFTILSNLLITVIFSWIALAPPGPGPDLQAATAAYMAVVGVGYSLLLRSIWDPQGLQKFLDVMEHDAMPILYILFWIIFGRRLRALPWSNAVRWLIAPLAYLLYSMIRGSRTGWYPYYFLNPANVGWPHIFSIIGGFLVAFLALGLVVIALTRRGRSGDSSRIPLA